MKTPIEIPRTTGISYPSEMRIEAGPMSKHCVFCGVIDVDEFLMILKQFQPLGQV
jgi:hypothetical protein